MPPERIHTERLLLRPVEASDAQAIFDGYASSPVATRMLNFSRHVRIDESIALVQLYRQCWIEGDSFPWTIVLAADQRFVGTFELRLSPPRADFGFVLCEAFWGRGFATEAARAVVDWTLAQPQIRCIGATCHPDNAASARVLQKAGLRYEGRLENWEARPQLGETAGPSLAFSRTRADTPQPATHA